MNPDLGGKPVQFNGASRAGVRARSRSAFKNIPFTAGLVVITGFLSVAILSFFYVPGDPNTVSMKDKLLPFGSPGHLFGTDYLGRDELAQLVVGSGTSLIVVGLAAMLGLGMGLAAGLVAAARGGIGSEAIMRAADILLSVPTLVTALVLAATMGPGILSTVIALGGAFTPGSARVVRSAALRVLEEDFVSAARLYGRTTTFIVFRHVIPNILSIVIVQASLLFAVGLLAESGLSYLGVGVQRPRLSWGLMLQESQQNVGISSILTIWPGVAIVIVVLGFNLLGDGIRDVFDPKQTKGR